MKFSSRQVYALRKSLRLSQGRMGQLVGRSRWSIDRWERGATVIPPIAQIVLNKVAGEHHLMWVRGQWCRSMVANPVKARVERNPES